jgi:putative phosphoribosyl transferase
MVPSRRSKWEGVVRDLSIQVEGAALEATLALPKDANGLVLFAHGSGSSRHSPRNRYVAEVLHTHKIATVLFDLLTGEEERIDQYTGALRFDIPFLAARLIGVTNWMMNIPEVRELRVGYFGASTGAGAALIAAAELPALVYAVVSRGGRPDLAKEALPRVLVGGNDEPVIAMNREALARLGSRDKELLIIPGATHLFEEAGTLEEVARLAAEWFVLHFRSNERPTSQRAAPG